MIFLKNSIFRYPLTYSSRSILFFIGLVGLLYGSLFWTQIIPLRDYIQYLDYYPEYYLGRIISVIFLFIFQLMIFAISIYFIIKCVKTRGYNPDHELDKQEISGTSSLFGFRLTKTSCALILIVSIVGILYWIPNLISKTFSLLWYVGIIIESTGDLNIGTMLTFSQMIFYSSIATISIVIFLITGIKCMIAKREIFR